MTLTLKTLATRICALSLLLCISISSFAVDIKVDKTTEKARAAVENATPDDWYTLASSAKKCIDRGVNLKEAAEWLDKSLAIKETVFNLKVKGDYYVESNLPEKALECYSKSIRVGKIEDPAYMDADTQEKILKLVKQLG